MRDWQDKLTASAQELFFILCEAWVPRRLRRASRARFSTSAFGVAMIRFMASVNLSNGVRSGGGFA
ncbi:MAG: hypothetical protein ACREMB_07770 [Candidatus Rokuibacteriota bacterium]